MNKNKYRHKWEPFGGRRTLSRCIKCGCIKDRSCLTVRYTFSNGGQTWGQAPDCISTIAIDSKTLNEHTNENNQDNEPPMCHWCNGTGENTSGTGSCRDCKGTGVQVKKK